MGFGVTIDFDANVAKFTKDINGINNQLTRFGKNAATSFDQAKLAAVGFVGVFGAIKLASFLKSGIDTADMLSNLSTRTGVAVEELAGLKFAADLSDTSIQEIGLSINKLSIFMGQNSEAAKQLGIDAESPIEAFLQFADVFSGISGEQTKAALGNKVLGRSFANLAPLLDQGSEAIRKQIEEGKKLVPVTKEMAEQSAIFNDNLTILAASASQFSIVFGGPIVKDFNLLIDSIKATTTEVTNLDNVFRGIREFIFDDRQIIGLSHAIDNINQKIVSQREKVRVIENEGGLGRLVDGLLGYNPGRERDKLFLLLERRGEILEDFKKQRDQQTEEAAKGKTVKVTDEQVEKFISNGKQTKENNKAQQAQNELSKRATTLFEQTRTALEKLTAKKAEYNILLKAGKIDQETFNRAILQANNLFEQSTQNNNDTKTLAQINAQIKAKQALLDADNALLQQRLKFDGQTDDSRFNPGFFDQQTLEIPATFKVKQPEKVIDEVAKELKQQPLLELPKFNDELVISNVKTLNQKIQQYLTDNPVIQTVSLKTVGSGGDLSGLSDEALASGTRG